MVGIPLLENIRRVCCLMAVAPFGCGESGESVSMGLMNVQPYCRYFGQP